MHEAYRPISLLTALWPTQDYQFPGEIEEFGQRVQQQFPQFNELRIALPPGGQAQAEWPYLTLLGDQRGWALELAPGKVSLRRSVGQSQPLEELFQQHYVFLAPVLSWLSENYNFRAYRLGVVAHLFCNTRSSANEKIAHYFLNPRATMGQTPYDVNINILNRINLYDNVQVNRWLRVRPLRTIDARRVDFAAQVEVDINTMPEDTQVRTARDLADFMEAARDHLDHEIPILEGGDFVE